MSNKKVKVVLIEKVLGEKIKELVGSGNKDSKELISVLGRSLVVIYEIDSGEKRGYDRNLFKSSIAGKFKTLSKNKKTETLKNAFELLKHYQEKTNSIVFTPKNSIWKLEPKKEVKPAAKKETKPAAKKEAKPAAKKETKPAKVKETIDLSVYTPGDVRYNPKTETFRIGTKKITAEQFKEIQDNRKAKVLAKKEAKPAAKNTPKPASELTPPEAKKPAKRAPRIAVRALLNSNDPKEVFLGFIYKLSHAVAATKKTKQGKALISRYMNAIKKGYMLEGIEVINKELGDDIEQFAPNVLAVGYEATKEEEKIFSGIFERYRSFMNEKRAPKKAKYDKEKENALSILAKMRNKR